MVLNYDCMRAVLLAIEAHPYITSELSYNYMRLQDLENSELLQPFSLNDIIYTITILNEGELINAKVSNLSNRITDVTITRLTKSGHDLLEHIKSDNNWNKIKSVTQKIGAASIDIIIRIAANVIVQLINQQM